MQIHVREVGIGGTVDRPALLVVAAQAVVLRQRMEQLSTQPQPLGAGAHAHGRERPLGAMDLPAAAVGVEKKVQQRPGPEQGRQGLQTGLGLPQVVQHPHRIDVVEGAFPLELQQAAVLDANPGLGPATGAAQPLTGHRQRAGGDVHRQDLGPRVEVGEVVGAHPGAAAGIQDPQGLARLGLGRQCTGAGGIGRVHAPAPVVPGWWPVLKGITGVGETVVEVAYHRGGGIGWGLGHAVGQAQGSCAEMHPNGEHFMDGGAVAAEPTAGCKHLFMGPREA